MRSKGDNSDDPAADENGVEIAAATVGEAKWLALKELEPRYPGITAEAIEFEVVREADGDVQALVRATVDYELWDEVGDDLPEEPAERLRLMVTRVVQALGLRATVDISDTEDELRATVNGEDLGLLIGKHGATIDALQHLALRIALRGGEDRRQVVVDAAGYRERRENALQRTADQAVSDALRYKRPVELEPMRPLERKVVHKYLSERTDVETHSEGDEPDRRLVVSPAGS